MCPGLMSSNSIYRVCVRVCVLHLKNLDVLQACNSIDEQIPDISNLFKSSRVSNAFDTVSRRILDFGKAFDIIA